MIKSPSEVTTSPHPSTLPAHVPSLLRLSQTLSEIPSVRRLGLTHDGCRYHFWAILAEDNREDAERIYEAEHEYAQQPGIVSLEVHVVPLDIVDERNLPPMATIFERA